MIYPGYLEEAGSAGDQGEAEHHPARGEEHVR